MKNLKFLLVVLFIAISCEKKTENKEVKKQSIELANKEQIADSYKSNVINESFKNNFIPDSLILNGKAINFQEKLNFGELKYNTSTFYIGNNIASDEILDLDEDGVSRQNGEYHPTHIAKVALKAINDFKLSNSKRSLKIFEDQLKWTLDNFHEKENYGFWSFSFDAPLYKLEKG
ncbi:MAG: hypothetical protein ACTHXJ_09345, partial [Mesonia sp.]